MRGKPERLLWSDESARAVVASKFLGNRETPSEGRRVEDRGSKRTKRFIKKLQPKVTPPRF
jgi:hypothetical protein